MECIPVYRNSKSHCFGCNLGLRSSCYKLGTSGTILGHRQLYNSRNIQCNAQVSLKEGINLDPIRVVQPVKAFAPATIANLGAGFDFLGCAVEGLGDHVTVEVNEEIEPGQIVISAVNGDNNRLSFDPMKNYAGIAAKAIMKLPGVQSVGLSLSLHKGLPLGSGLGSSAASAAVAGLAVNGLFGSKLPKSDLVLGGLQSEAAVSGYHADNVAPSLMGGFVLVRSYKPLDLISLSFPSDMSPAFEAPTKEMRAVLAQNISMKSHIANSSQAAALVAAILQDDPMLLGAALTALVAAILQDDPLLLGAALTALVAAIPQGDPLLLGAALSSDSIVEPRRGPLIPGMLEVKKAAHEIGAFGRTISGAGPTALAITDSAEKGKAIAQVMVDTFLKEGKLEASASVQKLDRIGSRVV